MTDKGYEYEFKLTTIYLSGSKLEIETDWITYKSVFEIIRKTIEDEGPEAYKLVKFKFDMREKGSNTNLANNIVLSKEQQDYLRNKNERK